MRPDVRKRACLLIMCGLAGCQGRSSPVNTAPPVKSAPAVISDAGGSRSQSASDQKLHSPEPDPAPVAAVKTVLRDVDAGKLESLADFLPESYVQELESLLRSAVEKTPDDLWRRLQAIAGKIRLLVERQPKLFPGDSPEHRQQLAIVLQALGSDAAWDRANWKAVDLKSLLRAPGTKLLAARQQEGASNPPALSQTDVRLVTLDGDQATLQLHSVFDAEPRSVQFVQIEEKWIPQPLAEAWPATIGKAAGWLNSVSDQELTDLSQRIDPALLQIEGTLDQMIRAERLEEVQLGWWQIQSLLIQARQDLLEPGPPPQVELHLADELPDEQMTDLLNRLIAATDSPDAGEYLTFPSATGTVIQISPVADFDEFVTRLTFVAVKSTDAEARRVDIERQRGQ